MYTISYKNKTYGEYNESKVDMVSEHLTIWFSVHTHH